MNSHSPDRRGAQRPDSASRRTRLRLRELCDEVIASHRIAKGADAMSASERADAQALLAQVTPRIGAATRLSLAD